MKELTPEEIEAWDGLCESYDEMAEEIERSAP